MKNRIHLLIASFLIFSSIALGADKSKSTIIPTRDMNDVQEEMAESIDKTEESRDDRRKSEARQLESAKKELKARPKTR